MRGASRHRLRPGGAAVRAGQGLRQPSGALRHRPLHRLGHLAPSSRSPASTCSPPAISSAARAPKRSCCTIPCGGVYKKLVIKDDKLVGACLYGDTVDGSWYFQLLRDGTQRRRHSRPPDVRPEPSRRRRPRGPEQGRRHDRQRRKCAAATACRKGTIVKAIKEKGLFTLDDVRKHTKAARSCGSCTGLVEQILVFTAGGDYSAAPKTKSMCGCTDHTPRGGARRDPRRTSCCPSRRSCSSLEWRTPNGCATCRPALNYYLISTWPKRGQGRSAVALHQRARPRQHPEGRHLLA